MIDIRSAHPTARAGLARWCLAAAVLAVSVAVSATANASAVESVPAFSNTTGEPGTSGPAIENFDVSYDRWDHRWGQSIADVGSGELPNSTSGLNGGLVAPSNAGDQYAMRMRTLLTPTESGRYRFYLAGDDDARLFVNPRGDDPIGARLVAYVAGWTTPGQWDRFASQRSGWLQLAAGTSYYVEVIGKEGSGDDHFSVGWERRGTPGITVVPAEVLRATDLGSGGWRPATPAGLPSTPGPFDPRWQVSAGVETLQVSWTPPAGATWFDVRLEGGGEHRRVKVQDPTITFERLVPETRYVVQVTPANAGGTRSRAVGVFSTAAGEYPTPVTPTRGIAATASYDRWNTGWWTLTSIPDGLAPTSTSTVDWGLETPPMQGENHAARLRALVTPQVSGTYRFFLSGDDDARLLFSPSGPQAFRARQIASVSGWTAQYQWDRYQSQTSRSFRLEAGRSYYIEAIGVHAFGLDHLEVGWSLDGGPVEVVPASVLRPTRQGAGGWHQSATALPRIPDRPLDVQLAPTHDAVVATWSMPEPTDRRGVADHFDVTIVDRSTGWSSTQTVDEATATFTGLTPTTRYTVNVRPGNAGGYGSARSASVRTLETPAVAVARTSDPALALYRARQGDPARGEIASRVYIERHVGEAMARLELLDQEADGDGWALVGRSNGAGESGQLASFRIEPDGTPVASIRHTHKGCLEVVPPRLDGVRAGETRIVRVRAEDTGSCRSEAPTADVDGDGVADDQQTLYRVRLNDPARGETVARFYIERSVVAAEAQLGRSDHDPDGDGWALVGRSNGSGEFGPIRSLRIVDGVPRVAIDHPRSGCLVFEPPTLRTVGVGQPRIVVLSPGQPDCTPPTTSTPSSEPTGSESAGSESDEASTTTTPATTTPATTTTTTTTATATTTTTSTTTTTTTIASEGSQSTDAAPSGSAIDSASPTTGS